MTQRQISILYFTNAIARGGAEEHILTLLRGLDRNRFCATLVCPPVLAGELREDVPADVRLVPLCFRKFTHVSSAIRLAGLLRELKADILHSHIFYSSLFASPIGWLCGVPVVLETPHLREHWRQGWLKSSYLVDRVAGKFVDYYIAVSAANKRYLVEQKRLPAEKVLVIRNGSDLRRFDPGHCAPTGMRESLGFNPNDPIVLVAGRLEPQKGHSVLLNAWPLVQREFPNARLVCLGEGSMRANLESLATALGITPSVRFLGRRANVQDWLALCEATVLPSFYEGLPLVAIESLAAGRVVVATAVDGTPEVVVDGNTGLLVPPGDEAALAEAVLTLLRDPALRRRLALAGREWVVRNFDEKQQIRQTEDLYVRACEKALRRPVAHQDENRLQHEHQPVNSTVVGDRQ